MTTGDVFTDTNAAHRLVLIITFFSITIETSIVNGTFCKIIGRNAAIEDTEGGKLYD